MIVICQLVLRNLILRTEASMNPAHGTSSPVSITIFHRHAKARINTNSCIKQKRVWDGPFVLESDAILRKVRSSLLNLIVFLFFYNDFYLCFCCKFCLYFTELFVMKNEVSLDHSVSYIKIVENSMKYFFVLSKCF